MAHTSQDKPTVGRIVWIWLNEDEQDVYDLRPRLSTQPFRAEVLFVGEDGTCTLEVKGHDSSVSVIQGVQIFDPDPTDCHNDVESYATWMPYQKKQHDKHRGKSTWQDAKAEEGPAGAVTPVV